MRSKFLLVVLALAVLGAACGDSDDADAPLDTVDEAVGDVETPVVAVTAVDYAFQDLPAQLAAGTTLTLTNASDAELHELVAVRLPDDETRTAAELLALPEEEAGALFAGVTDVIVAPPGEAGFPVEGDGVIEEPGRYLVLCAIPVGIDPQAYLEAAEQAEGGPPEFENAGPPHFTQGMVQEVVVE